MALARTDGSPATIPGTQSAVSLRAVDSPRRSISCIGKKPSASDYLRITRPFSKAYLDKEFRKTVRSRCGTGLDSSYFMNGAYILKTVGRESDPEGKCKRCAETAQLICKKCKETYYCSNKCQISDWPTHKARCGQVDVVDYAVLVDEHNEEVKVSGPLLEGWALEDDYKQLHRPCGYMKITPEGEIKFGLG